MGEQIVGRIYTPQYVMFSKSALFYTTTPYILILICPKYTSYPKV